MAANLVSLDSALDVAGSSRRDERRGFVRSLPGLEEKDVAPDDTCAICHETFLAIIAAQEIASVMESLSEEDMGVIEIPGCRHRFCRNDIATWVYSSINHSTCPTCRHEFLPEPMRQRPERRTLDLESLRLRRERILQLIHEYQSNLAEEEREQPPPPPPPPRVESPISERPVDMEVLFGVLDVYPGSAADRDPDEEEEDEWRRPYGMYT